MQRTYYEEFEKYWKKFVTQLQGQLMMQAKKGVFIHSSLNLILTDCAGFWDSRHSEGGRWLDRYEAEYPEEANMVRDVLLKDMKFTEETSPLKHGALKYIIPVGSAVAGFSVATGMRVSNLTRAVCTVVPAAVVYPVANNIVNMKEESEKKDLIQAYIRQLDKYKFRIESILQGNG